jgi:hypothetical protein
MNMETLVALGSMASFFLFVFFLIKYTYEYLNGTLENKM